MQHGVVGLAADREGGGGVGGGAVCGTSTRREQLLDAAEGEAALELAAARAGTAHGRASLRASASSAVLPIPAGPRTSTQPPAPVEHRSRSAARSASRSSRKVRGDLQGTGACDPGSG